MDHLFDKVETHISSFFQGEKHSHSHVGYICDDSHPEEHSANRFQSFVSPSSGNAKWYVDGCSYFWAVSEALEEARESIFILDWWLSPELYLRRPPSQNERYRLDAMLKAAAERGVKVFVIVYKEVEAAMSLKSVHTKHALEALHPNIMVFRHPDHVPTGYDITSELGKYDNVTNFDLATVSKDALKTLYGVVGDVVLYWAHHEKLVVIDRKLVFMGGLDLCFGRWDTNSHPIADAHPGNLDNIIFPGQDYNNARIFDFSDVDNWDQNKLDRTKSSRMGWSDVALSLNGSITLDLVSHFVDRWNFIFDAKYEAKDPGKYERLRDSRPGRLSQDEDDSMYSRFTRGITSQMESLDFSSHRHHRHYHRDNDRSELDDGAARIQLTRSCTKWSSGHPTEHSIANAYVYAISTARHYVYIENQFFITATGSQQRPVTNNIGAAIVERIIRARDEGGTFKVWVVIPAVPAFAGDLKASGSLGTRAIMDYQYKSISRGRHSILEKLRAAGIEDPSQYIGFYNLRSYDRINISRTMRDVEQRTGIRYEDARKAHDNYANREDRYRSHDDYDSRHHYGNSRDGYDEGSRYDGQDGYDRPHDRYYTSYDDRDRHGYGGEYGRSSNGDSYDGGSRYTYQSHHSHRDDGRRYYEGDRYDDGARYDDRDEYEDRNRYETYQRGAARVRDATQDTVSSCYMGDGGHIANAPWDGSSEDELDAFVSEQLYIHSKLLIADDRLVICGSANLNDRSQLGTHDSEIAVVIEGGPIVASYMNGDQYRASEFATSLRRQIFRKHLGLLPDQPWDQPDQNWCSVERAPNKYDWDSKFDRIVEDPLSPRFMNLWEDTATVNTEVFRRAFHPVPDDHVRTWKDYDEFFSRHFIIPGVKDDDGRDKSGKIEYGHIVREEFPGGVEEVKEWLGRVRGNLVHMPLEFLADVDNFAEEGLTLNGLTNELYT